MNIPAPQPLSGKQTSFLRSLAHHRKVVVMVGNEGVTDALIAETNIALSHHELIKIKLSGATKKDRQQLLEQICENAQAQKVQLIGRIGIIFRAAETPKIQLPAA